MKHISKKPDWNLLAKFLSSECSQSEEKEIKKWAKQHPANQKIIEVLTIFWEKKKIPPRQSDLNGKWKKLTEKAGIYQENLLSKENKTTKNVAQNRITQFFIIYRSKRLIAYTAVLLLIILIPFLWKTIKNSFGPTQIHEMNKIVVNHGEKKSLTLSDGSSVLLDSGSQFKFPPTFNTSIREVYLSGEGYFEIQHLENKPFIVHANNAIVKVMGTKFNIRAWKETQIVKVAVAEGKVSLNHKEAINGEGVIISKGQISILPAKGKPLKPFESDIEKEFSWINREMIFDDVSLTEVLTQLERWYGVSFVYKGDFNAFRSLKLNILNQPLEDILELIQTITGLNYEKKENIIYLFSENPNGQSNQ